MTLAKRCLDTCACTYAFLYFVWRFVSPFFINSQNDSNMQMTRFSSEPLPTDWSTLLGSEEILFSSDIAVSRKSTLKAKVLVFRDLVALQRFWRLGLCRRKPDDGSCAVVSDVSSIITFQVPRELSKREHVWEVDPTYFCVMGFILGNLSMEYIAHESVHAVAVLVDGGDGDARHRSLHRHL